MKCKCGTENADSAKYCRHCRAILKKIRRQRFIKQYIGKFFTACVLFIIIGIGGKYALSSFEYLFLSFIIIGGVGGCIWLLWVLLMRIENYYFKDKQIKKRYKFVAENEDKWWFNILND